MQVFRSTPCTRLAALLALLLLSVGCANKFKDIEVTSCEISSLSPKGFRAVDGVLSVGIDNPASSFTVSGISGCVRKDDLVIATFTGGPCTVEKKCEQVYDLPCTLTLEEGLSLFQALSLIKNKDLEGYVIDISGVVSLSGGLKKKLEYTDIPITSLMEADSVKDRFKL